MDVIEMLRNLFYNEEAQAQWKADPQAYLEREGATNLSVAAINEAAQVACSPTDLGADVNVGGNQTVGDTKVDSDIGSGGPAPTPPPVVVAPPPPPAPPVTMPAPQQIEEVINYYVTNVTETNVDDRDTFVDNSVDVINVGGEVNIDQDTVIASGDQAVAAGGDNTGVNTGDGGVAVGGNANAPIVTGDDNIAVDDSGPVTVGDGNIVGDDNTVGDGNIDVDNSADGRGSESGDVIIGDGNENNDVDIDIDRGDGNENGKGNGRIEVIERGGEAGGDGAINIGVGSGDTTQDNHSEDNDGIDDKDFIDVDLSVDDHSVEDNDVIDVDANFGGGRPAVDPAKLAEAEQAEVVREIAEPEPVTAEHARVVPAAAAALVAEDPVAEVIEAVEESYEPPVEPETAAVADLAEAEPVEMMEE